MLTRYASLDLAERKTANDGSRVYPATLSTETPVTRSDPRRGTYAEILSHAPGAVDLSRAPVPS